MVCEYFLHTVGFLNFRSYFSLILPYFLLLLFFMDYQKLLKDWSDNTALHANNLSLIPCFPETVVTLVCEPQTKIK